MNNIFTAPAFVDETGNLKLKSESEFLAHVRRLKRGEYLIVVQPFVATRSLRQNAYLHAGPLPILKEEFGYDSIEDLKRDLMGECWGWKTSPLTGQQIPVRLHTSKMNVKEFAQFIDWLIPWAMVRHNVKLPLPSEDLRTDEEPAA